MLGDVVLDDVLPRRSVRVHRGAAA